MFVKRARPIDPWLTLAGLLPFDEKLPPLAAVGQQAIDEINRLWSETPGTPALPGSNYPEWRYEIFRQSREVLGALPRW